MNSLAIVLSVLAGVSARACAGNGMPYFVDLGVVTIRGRKPAVGTLHVIVAIRRSTSHQTVGWLALDQFGNHYVDIKQDQVQAQKDFAVRPTPRSASPFVVKPTAWTIPAGYELHHCSV